MYNFMCVLTYLTWFLHVLLVKSYLSMLDNWFENSENV